MDGVESENTLHPVQFKNSVLCLMKVSKEEVLAFTEAQDKCLANEWHVHE
jgi:hypothetical protein